MLPSIDQNKRALELITKSFKITKNIPIDYRFIVRNLENIDEEIPKKYRYNGLVFFVVESEVYNGTTTGGGTVDGKINVGTTTGGDKTLNGVLYCFEENLDKPIPLHDTVLRFIVRQVGGFTNDYSKLLENLNKTYAKAGSIVYVEGLNISVIFDGTNWKYFNGVYIINNDSVWNTVPESLRVQNKLVLSNNVRKIILNDLSLSDEVLTDKNIIQNNRYYDLNGILHYSIGDKLYKLGDNVFFGIVNIQKGSIQVTHGLNSLLIEGYCKLTNTNSDIDVNNTIVPLSLKIIDKDNVEIKSSLNLQNIEIVLISKQ